MYILYSSHLNLKEKESLLPSPNYKYIQIFLANTQNKLIHLQNKPQKQLS
jgi:hypothetical protein